LERVISVTEKRWATLSGSAPRGGRPSCNGNDRLRAPGRVAK
jgi:hypothetical protein